MKKLVYLSFLLLFACNTKQEADLIVHNAVVYTVDSSFTVTESFAVREGKIIASGTTKDILAQFDAKEKIDAKGKAVYPGFIDAHCHFYAYGEGLQRVDIVGTKSFDEVLERTIKFSRSNKSEWIIGRGWDQNDWDIKEFPDNRKLDSLFPNTPVLLSRIDGHAAIANSEALKRAGITETTRIEGGDILYYEEKPDKGIALRSEPGKGGKNFKLSGVLIDNAVDLVNKVIPPPSAEEAENYLLAAEKNCFEAGLTTVSDAGLMKSVIDRIDALHKSGKLKMRIYAMLTDSAPNFEHYLANGPYKTERLNVRSFKFYADGALGSRGACLLHPYHDQPSHTGFLLRPAEYFRKYAPILAEKGFQMNTHCIGDSAGRIILDIYADVLGKANDMRWRIEHAQVLHPGDLQKFKEFRVIPSVQPTHATSDMYWADERLGEARVKTAYAYKDLLKAAGTLALGTDFPVEHINPMATFFAAVSRTDKAGEPEGGFQTENSLTREETLRGMTIWAAHSNFEEKEKGSIEPGKLADFVILDTDIMKAELSAILSAKVLSTYVNGERVFAR